MTVKQRKFHAPLQLMLSLLLICMMLLLGGGLTLYTYIENSNAIQNEARQKLANLSRKIDRTLYQTFSPLFDITRIIAHSDMSLARNTNNQLSFLPLLTTAIRESENRQAIQIGYSNGDYLIVRQLTDPKTLRRFNAPPNAAFMLDSIVHKSAESEHSLYRHFYDDQLSPLGEPITTSTLYDPRLRPWYQRAQQRERSSIAAPYIFYFLGKAGTTVSTRAPSGNAVVAVDVTLEAVSEILRREAPTQTSELMLFNADGKVLAYPNAKTFLRSEQSELRLAALEEMGSPVIRHVAAQLRQHPEQLRFRYNERHWLGNVDKILISDEVQVFLGVLIPEEELLAEAYAAVQRELTVAFVIIVISIPVALYFSRAVSLPLAALTDHSVQISQFRFSHEITTDTSISEIYHLTNAMDRMKSTIGQFSHLITSLSAENDFDALLTQIARETGEIDQANGVLIYLCDPAQTQWKPVHLQIEGKPVTDHKLSEIKRTGHVLSECIRTNQSDNLVIHQQQEGAAAIACLFEQLHCHHLRIIALPLIDRQGTTNGLLCLLHKEDQAQNQRDLAEPEHMAFVKVVSSFAALSLETRQLLLHQKQLLDSFIRLIAGAIDAKSPYTGGHCQRVPELTKMLARAACASGQPPFTDFQLDKDGWEALHTAAWLHDCGKVTTPEHVVDKATKLETRYNRIHEIRTRFEVLKRDAEIHYWQQRADGVDAAIAKQALARTLTELDDDFAFVAECNLGGEELPEDKQTRLGQIAERTWQRTLDDQQGLSWEELQRKQRRPKVPLPATEPLLADNPDHLIARKSHSHLDTDNRWGFKVNTPQHKFNLGELYNLSVSRGTLTEEERYLINDHIVQTIIMLEQLPYPRHLLQVPAIAGGHHERMDGNGYPRGLCGEEMPLTARMMAIADIFEALTATDRPYKEPKKLSEAIRIMFRMRDNQHIDPDLFELFLTSGVYLEYARRYLPSEQIDEVDLSRLKQR